MASIWRYCCCDPGWNQPQPLGELDKCVHFQCQSQSLDNLERLVREMASDIKYVPNQICGPITSDLVAAKTVAVVAYICLLSCF